MKSIDEMTDEEIKALYKQEVGVKTKSVDEMSDDEVRAAYKSNPDNPWGTKNSINAEYEASIPETALIHAAKGFSFGLDDELGGGIEAIGRVFGKTGAGGPIKDIRDSDKDEQINLFSDNNVLEKLQKAYGEGRNKGRYAQELTSRQHPGTAFLGEMAGGIANPLNRVLPKGYLARAGTAGAQGAAYGYGNSRAENFSDQMIDAGVGGTVGAVLSPAFTAVSNTTIPKLGEILVGANRGNSEAYLRQMAKTDQLAKSGQLLGYVEDTQKAIVKALDDREDLLGKRITQALEETGGKLPIQDVKGAYVDRMNYLKSRPEMTVAEANELKALESNFKTVFGLAKPIKPKDEVILQDPILKQLYSGLDKSIGIQAPSNVGGVVKSSIIEPKFQHGPFLPNKGQAIWQRVLPTMEPTSQANKAGMLQLNPKVADQKGSAYLSRFFDETNDEILQHSDVLQKEANALAKAHADKNIKGTLGKISDRRGKIIEEKTQHFMSDEIPMARAMDLKMKLKPYANFAADTTPESFSVQNTAQKSTARLNDGFDKATDGWAAETRSNYSKMKDIRSQIDNNFKSPQSTYNFFSNPDANGKRMQTEAMKQLAKDGILNIDEQADVILASKLFGDKTALSQLSSNGATSTSRTKAGMSIGGGAGTLIGGGLGMAVGGPVGATIGATLGSGVGIAAAPLVFNVPNLQRALKASAAYDRTLGRVMPSSNAINATLPTSIYNVFKEQ